MTWLFPELQPEPTWSCLSLWQPWASLWAAGCKKNETRGWATTLRGPLLIHAAKRPTLAVELDDELSVIAADQFGAHWDRSLPRGAIIGSCIVTGCVSTNHLKVDAREYAQGNYRPDRYAFQAKDHQPFAQPVPYRGYQAIFQVPRRFVPAWVPA